VSAAATAARIGLLILLVPSFGVVGAAWASATGLFLEHAAYLVLTCRRFGLTAARVLAATWRTALAAAAMAGALHAAGIGWAARPGGPLDQAARLTVGSLAGAAVYGASLAALWTLAGRPRGPETDLAGFAARLARGRRLTRRARAPTS
jgi:peptidoglycan biosynthesis protein MviN/MurJ (putative lipid II flippase)